MGLTTAHLVVVVPSPFFFLYWRRPLETATNVSGAIMVREAPLSGSSLWWSLHGYHNDAPMAWHVTVIHGLPSESRAHVHPPLHGGLVLSCGVPEKYTRTRLVWPTV